MKSFEILMNILNSILEILNKNGWFIRDPLNKERRWSYYINTERFIRYMEGEDMEVINIAADG